MRTSDGTRFSGVAVVAGLLAWALSACGPGTDGRPLSLPPSPLASSDAGPRPAFFWQARWLARDKTPAASLMAQDRALYLALGGQPAELRPDIRITGPAGTEPPILEDPVWEESRKAWTVRVRFLEPGTGYQVRDMARPDSLNLDVPPVLPARTLLDGRTVSMTASPSVSGPGVPVVLSFALEYPTGSLPVDRLYALRVINPCGWGPEATVSVPAAADRFEMTLSASDMIDVTGNYTIRVADLSGERAYKDAPKATFTYMTR